jgi:hypothetical protein
VAQPESLLVAVGRRPIKTGAEPVGDHVIEQGCCSRN